MPWSWNSIGSSTVQTLDSIELTVFSAAYSVVDFCRCRSDQ